jgi:hypothetical protein
MDKILDLLVTQLISLGAFFLYPAIQYISLKSFAKKEGQLELWYLPDYGFRFVIRNIPNKKVLSDIKYKISLRKVLPSSSGSSVGTFYDSEVIKGDDFFLLPGTDKILFSFQIEERSIDNLDLIFTDKLGNEPRRYSLNDFNMIICEYEANLNNLFNFDIKLSKMAGIKKSSLSSFWDDIKKNSTERKFVIDEIIDIE